MRKKLLALFQQLGHERERRGLAKQRQQAFLRRGIVKPIERKPDLPLETLDPTCLDATCSNV